MIAWISEYWPQLIAAIYAVLTAAGLITGLFDGPKADKAKGVFQYILTILRTLGFGTYKNEPGSVSLPGKGDTGQRV